jgi:glycosyltransferase involved in cell wall biosynthesis
MSLPRVLAAESRLLIVQWSGDYREAYQRLSSGGEETYYAQRHTVDLMGELASRRAGAVGVLCCICDEPHDEVMGNGVRSMGAGLTPDAMAPAVVLRLVERFGPTHLIVTTPNPALLRWPLDRGVRLLPLLADTFQLSLAGRSWPRRQMRLLRHEWFKRRLAALLNDRRVPWAANHNLNASRQLATLGVDPRKIVPYDWPPRIRPEMFESRSAPLAGRPWRLLFVGAVTEEKGVGDLFEAVARLVGQGDAVELRVIGSGDEEVMAARAASLGIADRVRLEGRRPQDEVIQAMRWADVVIVPSRHSYPEGLPLVIYEAMATRTPLICSNHPAFHDRVGAGRAALVIPERSPEELAGGVVRLMTDPELYCRMSRETAEIWEGLQCPVRYQDLILRWLHDTPEDRAWLSARSLAVLSDGDAPTR